MTSDPKTTTHNNSSPKPKSKSFMPLLGLIGVAIIGLVVGSAILWEKKLENLVGFDLPHEDQETAETTSMIPFICERDPEACAKEPLTFQGRDRLNKDKPQPIEIPQEVEEVVVEETPIIEDVVIQDEDVVVEEPSINITYPKEAEPQAEEEQAGILGTLKNLPILKEMEEKLDSIEEIKPLQRKVEVLGALAVLDNVRLGHSSSGVLQKTLAQSQSESLKALASQVPEGRVIPFSQLEIIEVKAPKQEDAKESQSIWDEVLNWGASLVEIKTQAEAVDAERIQEFRSASESGEYDQAFALYEQLTPEQRQAYGNWIKEIQKRKRLRVLNEMLLQQLAGGA